MTDAERHASQLLRDGYLPRVGDEVDGDDAAPSLAAERQRRHRERRQAGRRVVSIEVDDEFVDQLVEWGWIKADQVKDPTILGDVIADILECRERNVFREGPIVVTGTTTGS